MTREKSTGGPSLSIGQIRVTVPGTSAHAGRSLANRVVDALGKGCATLPADGRGRVGDLGLRVAPRDLSEAAVAEAIADGVLRAVSRRGRRT